jgi:hypothetical protein
VNHAMDWTLLALVAGIAVALFTLAVAAMAIGVLFKRPCLRGSCGGPEVVGPGGAKLSCGACPNRKSSVH